MLYTFVVMPNHIHGIIEFNRNIVWTGRDLSLQQNRDMSLQQPLALPQMILNEYGTIAEKQWYWLSE